MDNYHIIKLINNQLQFKSLPKVLSLKVRDQQHDSILNSEAEKSKDKSVFKIGDEIYCDQKKIYKIKISPKDKI